MKALIQRVKRASVTIDGEIKSSIQSGLLVFVGFGEGDTKEIIEPVANKLSGLRIFEDEDGKMNLSVSDIGGEVLVVSQFTLYANCKKGRRPSFTNAAAPNMADEYYQIFVKTLEDILQKPVKTGEFGADMKVELLNDGPVTIMLDSAEIL